MKRLLLTAIALYRSCISPALHAVFPSGCRFHPTCSQYASEAIALHGATRGALLALRRLLRCHPFGASGFDPVPFPINRTPPSLTEETLHDPLP